MPLATAYLALGSNLGQRLDQMRSALRLLEAGGVRVRAVSHVYQNRAIGMVDADPFLNAVVQMETTLEPELLLDLCLKVETQLGRVRTAGWSPRTIDIDVLVYGEAHVETERLQVPHPRIAERDFVLQPLVDIQPDLKLFGRTVRELLEALPVVELEQVSEVLRPCM
ncbi:2-amino-4-hydroxy-6-hydroxymethyldihydropteridine diphosphokinase [Opitutales bacterium]|nr:2-amino-4-hydroxy-6-hydroxymethyldihydropteridine diphosphokinase [Opitutales bacterium]MDB2357586.1 2-amino-4-hydroxy-6-hydroxymethyldihydropteridine diphosphokinase [Opitutales bacterium]MDB2506663.1 2-amino-4-hydroxy-6-hydroxymethyldihydropteridine diphosphokinase [Opitutales bacterium]MDB2682077.1 2-amino-4-hydroxy-6-hydroxymethyldihydropteridine diphosphokinase [Opitutales bacterium]